MKKQFFALTLLLHCILCGAEPSGEKRAEEKPKVVRPPDMTPEELRQRTNEIMDSATSETNHSAMRSDEFKELLDAHGPAVKKMFVEKFREADHIILVKISHPIDFDRPAGEFLDDLPQYEYVSVRLSDAQKKAGTAALEAMDGNTAQGRSRCFFPHHRMDIVGRNGQTSRMLICVECNQVHWDEDRGLWKPEKITATLATILKSAGLDLEKDWKKLAQERRAKESAKGGSGK